MATSNDSMTTFSTLLRLHLVKAEYFSVGGSVEMTQTREPRNSIAQHDLAIVNSLYKHCIEIIRWRTILVWFMVLFTYLHVDDEVALLDVVVVSCW
jgi:hypothetical protein